MYMLVIMNTSYAMEVIESASLIIPQIKYDSLQFIGKVVHATTPSNLITPIYYNSTLKNTYTQMTDSSQWPYIINIIMHKI